MGGVKLAKKLENMRRKTNFVMINAFLGGLIDE